jgi:hypothetical protein
MASSRVRKVEAAGNLCDQLLLQLEGAVHGFMSIVSEAAVRLLAWPKAFAIAGIMKLVCSLQHSAKLPSRPDFLHSLELTPEPRNPYVSTIGLRVESQCLKIYAQVRP